MATWAVDALHVRLLVVGEPHMRTDNVDRLADMLTEDIEERQIDAVIVSGSIANEGGEFGADQTTLIDAFEGIGPLVIYHQRTLLSSFPSVVNIKLMMCVSWRQACSTFAEQRQC